MAGEDYVHDKWTAAWKYLYIHAVHKKLISNETNQNSDLCVFSDHQTSLVLVKLNKKMIYLYLLNTYCHKKIMELDG